MIIFIVPQILLQILISKSTTWRFLTSNGAGSAQFTAVVIGNKKVPHVLVFLLGWLGFRRHGDRGRTLLGNGRDGSREFLCLREQEHCDLLGGQWFIESLEALCCNRILMNIS